MTKPAKSWGEVRETYLRDQEFAAGYQEVVNEEIGAALKETRESKGLSQREVAERMGVTRSRVSQIEGTEGTKLTLEVLNRYANALGYHLTVGLQADTGLIPLYIFDAEPAKRQPEHPYRDDATLVSESPRD